MALAFISVILKDCKIVDYLDIDHASIYTFKNVKADQPQGKECRMLLSYNLRCQNSQSQKDLLSCFPQGRIHHGPNSPDCHGRYDGHILKQRLGSLSTLSTPGNLWIAFFQLFLPTRFE